MISEYHKCVLLDYIIKKMSAGKRTQSIIKYKKANSCIRAHICLYDLTVSRVFSEGKQAPYVYATR